MNNSILSLALTLGLSSTPSSTQAGQEAAGFLSKQFAIQVQGIIPDTIDTQYYIEEIPVKERELVSAIDKAVFAEQGDNRALGNILSGNVRAIKETIYATADTQCWLDRDIRNDIIQKGLTELLESIKDKQGFDYAWLQQLGRDAKQKCQR